MTIPVRLSIAALLVMLTAWPSAASGQDDVFFSQRHDRLLTSDSALTADFIRGTGRYSLPSVYGLPTHGSASGSQLQPLELHPYHFSPSGLPVWMSPGSSQWFVPGYGYRSSGFSPSLPTNAGAVQGIWLSPYLQEYAFGNRIPASRTNFSHHYWSGIDMAPWYLPGSSTNTRRRWPF